MNLTLLRRFVTQALIVVVALAAILTSGAPAQSLGDVARQEEARRQSAAKGKVYTNGDLRGAPAPATTPAPSPASPAPGASPAAGDAGAKAGAKPDPKADGKAAAPGADAKAAAGGDATSAPADGKGDEAAWRKRRQTIQDALNRAQAFASALQSQINGLTGEFAARDDPAQRARVGAERQKALTELDRVKKEIQQNTKALDDLQEEARRSGVPPGWLR
jgi:hypothetical protein